MHTYNTHTHTHTHTHTYHTYLHGGNLTGIEIQGLRKRGGYGATACTNVEKRLELGLVVT